MNNQNYLHSIKDVFFFNMKKGIFDPSHKSEIRSRYKKAFRIDLRGCSSCYMDAFFKLLNFKSTDMNNFKIKRGVQFNEHSDLTKRLNWKTQTDELCKYWLKKDPNNARFFDEIPEGYLDSIKKEPKKEAKVEVGKPRISTLIEDNVDEITENGESKSKKYRKRK